MNKDNWTPNPDGKTAQVEVFADFHTRREARAWLKEHKKELLRAGCGCNK